MGPHARHNVCDFWNSVCPKGDNCPKLHGKDAKRLTCKQLLARGHCMMFGHCNMAHPSPVSLANSPFMKDLVVTESMMIEVRDIYDSTESMENDKKQVRLVPVITSLSSFSWTEGTNNEIVVPGEMPAICCE